MIYMRQAPSATPPRTDLSAGEVAWLAGLLEGEGSFGFFSGSLTLSLEMTDEDVVSRVASMFGTAVHQNACRKSHHKFSYATRVRGSRAALFMMLVRPFMGERRGAAIDSAYSAYNRLKREPAQARCKALDSKHADLLVRWTQARNLGQSFRSFCADQGIGRRAAEQVIQRLEGLHTRVRATQHYFELPVQEFTSFKLLPLEVRAAWLAGLLEGEGCFRVYSSGGISISLQMTDRDIVVRAAEELGAVVRHSPPAKENWQSTWVCWTSRQHGREISLRLIPWLGVRRSARVNEALTIQPSVRVGPQQRRASEARAAWASRESGEGLRPVAQRLGMSVETLRKLVQAAP